MKKIYTLIPFFLIVSFVFSNNNKESEIISKRAQNAKHYALSNGKTSAVISGGSMHYLDKKGEWQDIDKTIKSSTETGFNFENKTNNIKSFFPLNFSNNYGVKIASEKGAISIGQNPRLVWINEYGQITEIESAGNVNGTAQTNNLLYKNLFSSVDYEFLIENDKVKNNLILKQLPNQYNGKTGYLGFSEKITLPPGWTLHANNQKISSETTVNTSIIIKNSAGEITFVIPLPDTYEKNNPSKTIVADGHWETSYKIIPEAGGARLITLTPLKWLTDPSRNFPVVIDPVVAIPGNWGGWQNGSGAPIEGNPTIYVFTGNYTGIPDYRAWTRFNITSIPTTAVIDVVEAQFYMNGNDVNTAQTIDINDVSGAYGPYTTINAAAYNDFATGTYTSFSAGAIGTYGYYNLGAAAVTSLQGRLTSGMFQLALRIPGATTWKRFTSDLNYIRVTYNSCMNSTAPSSATAAPATICPGGSSTLTVNGGSLGAGGVWRWYSGSCGGTLVGSGASVSVSPGATTTYFVRAEGTCNTTTCVSVTVTVNSNSTAPTSATASPATICPSGSSTLTVNGGSLGTGGFWRWYSGSCGGTLVGSGASVSVSPVATTTYFVRAEGTCNTTACVSVTVTVNSNSAAPTSATASSATICPGGSSNLTLTGGSLGSGASWQWYSGSCGGSLIGSGTSVSVSPGATTTYFVRAEGTCNTTTCASVTVTVSSNSTAPTSASASPATICPGGSSTLTVNGGSLGTGASWQWFSTSCGGISVGSGASISVTPAATTTYFVRAEGICNTSACVSVTVTVSSNSTAPTSATASAATICSGNSSTLTVNGGSLGVGASWEWYSASCGGTAVGSGSSVTVSPTATTTYFVRAVGACNTTSCVSVTVTVDQNSTAPTSATASPTAICPGGSSTLTVNGGSLGTGASWQWYSTSCGGTAVGSGATILVSPTTTTTYFVRAEGTCNNTICQSVAVTVNSLSTDPTSISASATTICEGNSTTLTVNGGSTGTGANWEWYSSTCGGSIVGSGASITVSPTTTTTYFVRAVGTCNTSLCTNITINVESNSVAATSANATPAILCNGNSTTLTLSGGSLGTAANWEWYSGSCGGTPVGSGASVSISPTATTTYFVRAEGTCNNTICQSITVTVNTLSTDPTAANATPLVICDGNSSTLTVTGGSLGTGANWEWFSGSCAGTAVGTGTSISVSPTSTTTYFVRSEGTCNNTLCEQVTVTVESLSTDPISITESASSVCTGNSVTLTVNGGTLGTGADWEWYSGSCNGTPVGTGSSVTLTVTGNTTYFVNAVGSCNTTNCVQTTITTIPGTTLPTTLTPSTNPVCPGDVVTITMTGEALEAGANWAWYSGSCGGTSEGTGNSLTVNPTITTTYFVRAEGGSCGNSACESIIVNVNTESTAVSSIDATSNSVCAGSSVTLDALGGTLGTGADYQWFEASCNSTVIGNGQSITVNPTVVTTYFVNITGACNTTLCEEIQINMEVANIAANSVIASSTNLCESSNITLTVDGGQLGSGADWEWYDDNCSGTIIGTGNSINVSPGVPTTYYVAATGGCNTTTCVSVDIQANPIPAAWTIPSGNFCATDPAYDLSTWLNTGTLTNGIWYGSGVSASTFDPSGLSGNIEIAYVTGSGICLDSVAQTIEILEGPIAPIVTSSGDSICAGSAVVLNASGSGTNSTYQVYSIVGGSPLGTTPLTVNPATTTSYNIVAVDTNGCANVGGAVSVTIVASQPPDINAGSDTETCLGSSVILSASSSGSITWSTGENLASISVSPLINTVYYATALENGCSNSDSVAVQIITSSYITATNDSVITDQPVTILINVAENDSGNVSPLVILNGPTNGVSSVNIDGMINYTPNTGFSGIDSLSYEICHTSCDEICVTATLYITVETISEIKVPGGISPNGDGVNDVLIIRGIEHYPENVLMIFNRWGDEVYKAAPYINDWKGQSTKGGLRVIGDEVVDGTYFYILKLSPDHKGMQGPIELIRK